VSLLAYFAVTVISAVVDPTKSATAEITVTAK
jgi:hypothetical protein